MNSLIDFLILINSGDWLLLKLEILVMFRSDYSGVGR